MELVSSIPLRLEKRNEEFQSVPLDQMRARSQGFIVELRKKSRSKDLLVKRSLNSKEVQPLSEVLTQECPQLLDPRLTTKEVLVCLRDLLTSSDNIAEYALEALRHCMAVPSPPFKHFYQVNLLKPVLNFCTVQHSEKILEESCWVLCNLAAGPEEFTQELLKERLIHRLVALIRATTPDKWELPLWALANLAVEEATRQEILQSCLLEVCDDALLLDSAGQEVLAWLCSNLSRGSNCLARKDAIKLIDLVSPLVISSADPEILFRSLITLSNVCHHPPYIELLTKRRSLNSVITHLESQDISVALACIKCIGNVCAGTHAETQLALDANILEKFSKLLANPSLTKEVCWALSNIAAGTHAQVYELISHSCFPTIIEFLKGPSLQVAVEASFVVLNIARVSKHNPEMQYSLLKYFDTFAHTLKTERSPEILANMLELFIYLVGAAKELDKKEELLQLIQASGCLEAVERLWEFPNNKVADSAFFLLSNCLVQE